MLHFCVCVRPQPLELAAHLNRKEMFYHIIFKDREICWQYGSRVNYNLDLRVVDGAPKRDRLPAFFFGRSAFPLCGSFGSLVIYDPCASTIGRCTASADLLIQLQRKLLIIPCAREHSLCGLIPFCCAEYDGLNARPKLLPVSFWAAVARQALLQKPVVSAREDVTVPPCVGSRLLAEQRATA